MHPIRAFLPAVLLTVLATYAGDYAGWHHPASPYRAVYEVTKQPNVPEAGYFLQVPVCGLGDPGGETVYVFDDKNREFRVRALGPSTDGTALIQAGRDREQVKMLYAYWGSNRKAPQYKMLPPGLTLAIRTFKGKADVSKWDKSRRLLDDSVLAGVLPVDTIELSTNPLTADDAFIMDYHGAFRRDQPATLNLFLVNDDAGYLLIDDKVVIDRSGNHRPHDNVRAKDREAIKLGAGLTPFECVVIDAGGEQMAVLAQYVNDRKKFTLPADAYVQPGRAKGLAVENRLPQYACPSFWTRQPSYIGIDNFIYTEVELQTYTGQEVDWRLGDGGRLKGAKVSTIRVGLSPLTVEAAADRREVASSTVHFATVPPQQRWQNGKIYRQYSDIMLAQDLERLDAVTLNGYLNFLDLRERNADVVPVCEAILKNRQAKQVADPKDVLLALARGAARNAPDKAETAYKQLLQLTRDRDIILEVVEFLLYRQADYDQADDLLNRSARILGNRDRQLIRYRAELELLRGNTDELTKDLAELGELITADASFRQNTVLVNATIERFRDHLEKGYVLEAEADLRALGAIAPDLYSSGHYALLRAQLFRRLGWNQAAATILARTTEFNALPAYLPDMELERARALLTLKRDTEAKELLNHIVETFPNHPVAATAKQLLTP